jgi:MFS family permease
MVSSYIYLPALVPMARDLRMSITLINLTVISYLMVAGVAPAFMGDMADQSEWRPIYVLMFLLMIGANVGMALQTSYPALLVLLMLQSAGSLGPYGATYGIVADIALPRKRGSYVGMLILWYAPDLSTSALALRMMMVTSRHPGGHSFHYHPAFLPGDAEENRRE